MTSPWRATGVGGFDHGLVPSRLQSLRARNLADKTVRTYADSARQALPQLFALLAGEEDVEHDPMTRMRPPARVVPEEPVAVLTLAQHRALVAAGKGKSFTNRMSHGARAFTPSAHGAQFPPRHARLPRQP